MFWPVYRHFFSIRAEATVEKKTVNWARTKLTMIVYYNKLVKRAFLLLPIEPLIIINS